MIDLTKIDVTELRTDSIDVTPEDRDWSEGWPEQWDWLRVPECPECEQPGEEVEESHVWKCNNPACENQGAELEDDDLDEGPMMNYSYDLPDIYDQSDAAKLAGLPLCIVTPGEDNWRDAQYALALTGGGMDLSWEICEAYIRLDLLPPTHYCDLPKMSGRGSEAYSEESRARDAVIVAACKRACEVALERKTNYLSYTLEKLNRL